MAKIEKLKLEVTFSPSGEDSQMMILRTEVNGHPDEELWSYPVVIAARITELLSHMSLKIDDIIYLPTE